jgi:hypothetical protein
MFFHAIDQDKTFQKKASMLPKRNFKRDMGTPKKGDRSKRKRKSIEGKKS